MTSAKRRRRTWAIALSALAHVAVLVMALLQRPNASLPIGEGALPPDDVIHVLLMPRTPPTAAAGRAAPNLLRVHRPPRPADGGGAPLESPPSAAPTFAPTQQTPPGPDLRAALRHGAAGCANLRAVGMTRAEREGCEEQLARGASTAPFMPAAIEPRMRSYYDAVELAKQRDPPHVAVINKAPIPGDPPPHRPGGDHLAGIGCSIPFGVGQKPKKLPHAFYLGPCFIEPPKGSLDPEVDITPP